MAKRSSILLVLRCAASEGVELVVGGLGTGSPWFGTLREMKGSGLAHELGGCAGVGVASRCWSLLLLGLDFCA